MLNSVKLKVFKLSEEDVAENGYYFREGVHEVIISDVEFMESKDKKIYAEFKVVGKNGEEATPRIYFTENAKKISIDTIRKILVHNAETEEVKQAIRDKFKKVTNLLDLNSFLEKTKGKQAWLKVEKSDHEYTDEATGEVKISYNRNIYGFEPKITPKPEVKQVDDNEEITAIDQQPDKVEVDDLDYEEEIDLSDIPF